MPENLLLLRLGYLREFALTSLLRRSDVRLAVLDDHASPHLRAADWALPVTDVHDQAAVLDLCRGFLRRHGAGGVLTFQDSSLLAAARLAAEFDLPGWEREPLARAIDKHATRAALARAGLPCPRHAVAGSLQEAAAALTGIGLPAVLKPTDRSAGRGVVVVTSWEQLESRYETARAGSLAGRVLVEEFMDGPEVSVESATADGRTTVLAVTGKAADASDPCVEMGHVVPCGLAPEQERAARELARSALRAIGFRRGVAHTEVKITPRGPQIVEINARVAGDCIPELVHLASGVNLYDVAADLALGMRVGAPEAGADRFHDAAAIRFLAARPGRIVRV
ncbi:MAG TPA: ATP-grasp domain-containing protein, partial [Candidatus Eisenbacteria bacterium]|nr:ATP-grasp domain-containing protein [Candidatus Eisenbacteria bacterium]